MARRRGVIAKCPVFSAVSDGRQACVARSGSRRFLVERYKNGRLTAWLIPSRGSISKSMRLPTSTRPTRSLRELLEDANVFLDRVRHKYN